MQQYTLPHTGLAVSRLAYGCMRIGGGWNDSPLTNADQQAATEAVMAAYEAGITLFDHADIYTRGKSEAVFGEICASQPGLRDNIILQSKCGIRFKDDPLPGDPQRFDFSADHIVSSVEGSLRRLQTDRLDVLLLHRPDPLVEPEEVARAFEALHRSGKVRHFGVSNHTVWQMELLQRFVDQPLVVNQLEVSLLHHFLISEGIVANRTTGNNGGEFTASTGILDYCRVHDILVQAWSPVAGGKLFDPAADAPENVREAAQLVDKLAADKQTTPEAIALAWLLRHPAGIQPIIGTTTPERIQRSIQADEVELSREEWYALLAAARGKPVP